MTPVKIQPLSKRARERVRQHGDCMLLVRTGTHRGQRAAQFRSLETTWSHAGQPHFWSGWFTESEALWTSDNVESAL